MVFSTQLFILVYTSLVMKTMKYVEVVGML